MQFSDGSPYPPSESDISEIPRDLEKEDAIEKLSFLPNPPFRPRCLTPPGFRDVATEHPGLPNPTFQHCSYYKLPPDIRRFILILAFGNCRLHMDFSYDYPDMSSDFIQPLDENHCGIVIENIYAEAIDILYSTNIIIMVNEAMMTHLTQLLLPQRLAFITSLEISWNLKSRYESGLWSITDDEYFIDEEDLKRISQIISTQFPQLRRLYLSLELSRQLGPCWGSDAWPAISRHLDNLARIMPSLTEHAISLPDTPFDSILYDAKETDFRSYSEICHSYNQIWRSTDGHIDVIRLPYVDSYPRAPCHIDTSTSKGKGYCILNGSNWPEKEKVVIGPPPMGEIMGLGPHDFDDFEFVHPLEDI
ncbi:hypothetical protein NOF04DRAFT_11988 [Fusarium oxysporum II5]|uniref:DUF7730 domain-containing protein n=2 Tax=Fusarium oxysporum species complex TaxID=171631 RepID=X0K268_FUSO5|nr:uncharacterized protein FOIG_02558 [Fusarium odoratissimum NRRL 54006]EXM07558.1 hypothetical protein FOIG_02558 [Fusarium odoratissimum NRRL 54006]KAK2130822.1 hypothetical protein NOF04DRAFT_11988 [Fusarium oxysporum II5]TXC09003.1 hypothetical protein FocTR4_00004663 [Fusarium oxysporum f. sp. cubense]